MSVRGTATGLLLAAGGIVVGLLLVEAGLRLFVPLAPGSELRLLHELRPDRPWLYGMRPGAAVRAGDGVRYVVNAAGFRGPMAAIPKPPGTFRLLALGDSVTFGYGVDEAEAYPEMLRGRLAAAGAAVDVVNLGVSGYNPYTEAALFADRGVAYRPDVVVVQFCVNDLNDPTMHFDRQTAIRLSALPDAAFPDPLTRGAGAVLPSLGCSRLRLCRLLDDALFGTAPTDPDVLRAGLAMRADPTRREVAWLQARYGDIARDAARIDAAVVLLIVPFATQLDATDDPALQAALVGLATRLGWRAVDLLPAFRAAARDGQTLFTDPWHPTPAGHRLAADVLARRLACAGLAPAPARALCDAAPPNGDPGP